jgi:hypothetical protein
MDAIRFYRFIVTHDAGAIEVFLGADNARWYEECKTDKERREFIAHEAWRQLFESPAKRMIKQLCDSLGVDVVKKKFTDNIRIQEKR